MIPHNHPRPNANRPRGRRTTWYKRGVSETQARGQSTKSGKDRISRTAEKRAVTIPTTRDASASARARKATDPARAVTSVGTTLSIARSVTKEVVNLQWEVELPLLSL